MINLRRYLIVVLIFVLIISIVYYLFYPYFIETNVKSKCIGGNCELDSTIKKEYNYFIQNLNYTNPNTIKKLAAFALIYNITYEFPFKKDICSQVNTVLSKINFSRLYYKEMVMLYYLSSATKRAGCQIENQNSYSIINGTLRKKVFSVNYTKYPFNYFVMQLTILSEITTLPYTERCEIIKRILTYNESKRFPNTLVILSLLEKLGMLKTTDIHFIKERNGEIQASLQVCNNINYTFTIPSEEYYTDKTCLNLINYDITSDIHSIKDVYILLGLKPPKTLETCLSQITENWMNGKFKPGYFTKPELMALTLTLLNK